MKRVLLVVLALGVSFAQPPAERPFKIIRLDAALDDIISPDAKLETLGDHFGLTEGPVWVQRGGDGYLLFSDNAGNEIYKWSPHAPLADRRTVDGNPATRDFAVTFTRAGAPVAVLLVNRPHELPDARALLAA